MKYTPSAARRVLRNGLKYRISSSLFRGTKTRFYLRIEHLICTIPIEPIGIALNIYYRYSTYRDTLNMYYRYRTYR